MRGALPAAVRRKLEADQPVVTYPSGYVLIAFSVPGKPVPKARPRLAWKGGTYTPTRTVEAEHQIAQYAFIANPRLRPYDGSVAVKIDFYVTGGRRGDIDNLVKTVLDACCNGLIVTNDALIDAIDVHRYWVQSDPHTDITVTVLEA